MLLPFFSESPTRAQQWGFLLLSILIVGLAYFLQRKPDVPDSLPPTWPNWDSVLVAVPASCILPDSFELKPSPFNPNTVSDSALRRMGLRHKVVQTWMNYRNKGGHFYKAEQVQRLYALHDTEFKQLAPFIRIPETNNIAQKQDIKPILLNQADTAALSTLPGIGSKRAEAIVQYREALGGFVQKEQLLEISIIDTATFQRIEPFLIIRTKALRCFNLNEVTWAEFKTHPYFKGELGREILAWRKAKNYHIENLEELMEIKAMDGKIFRKIAPYLSLSKP